MRPLVVWVRSRLLSPDVASKQCDCLPSVLACRAAAGNSPDADRPGSSPGMRGTPAVGQIIHTVPPASRDDVAHEALNLWFDVVERAADMTDARPGERAGLTGRRQ